MNEKNYDYKSLWLPGLAAGLLATLCCVGPVVPILLGIGGASLLLGLDQFRPLFIGLGILILSGASWYAVRHRRQCCAQRSHAKEALLVAMIFGIGITAYAAFQYGVVPVLSYAARQSMTNESQAAIQYSPENVESLSVGIEGMTCEGCAVGVQKILFDIPGVVSAEVDWKTGKATIQYQTEITSRETIKTVNLPSPYILKEMKKSEGE